MARAVAEQSENASVYFHDRSFTGGRSWSAAPRVDDPGKWTAMWSGDNEDALGDLVLVYDWVWESDDVVGEGSGWLQAAADNLFASLLNPPSELGLAGDALLRRPLHFIGHSRGAVLNSLVVNQIGRYDPSLTVDQFTSLDPHPWTLAKDPGYESQTLQLTNNIQWADNYYRQDGIYEPVIVEPSEVDFAGVLVPGARNLELNEEALDASGLLFDPPELELGYATEHSDVHLWYAATIDTAATELESEDLANEIATGWWAAGLGWLETSAGSGEPDSGRDNVGYAYSLEAGKTRPFILKNGWVPPDAEPVGVVNGDFQYGDPVSNELPGWERHGGQNNGDLTPAGRLRFSIGHTAVTHNPLYVPETVDAVQFSYEVSSASRSDRLEVYLGDRLARDSAEHSRDL